MSSYEEYIQQGLGGEAPLKVIPVSYTHLRWKNPVYCR